MNDNIPPGYNDEGESISNFSDDLNSESICSTPHEGSYNEWREDNDRFNDN